MPGNIKFFQFPVKKGRKLFYYHEITISNPYYQDRTGAWSLNAKIGFLSLLSFLAYRCLIFHPAMTIQLGNHLG